MTTPTDTATLADEIEALAKAIERAKANPPEQSYHIDGGERSRAFDSYVHDLMAAVVLKLPSIVSALREVSALKQEVERLRAQDWQPIETAPKDGTRILLWMEPVQDARFVVSDGPHAVVGNWVVWSEAGKREGMRDGWSWYGSAMHSPTHWRPLPAPPSRAALGGKG